MSKKTRILFAVATIAIMTLVFTGCGVSKEEEPFIGKWEVTGAKAYGVELTAEQIDKEASYFEFKKNGKAHAKLFGDESSLKWKIDKENKNTAIIDDGSTKMPATINDDGTMTMREAESGVEFYLKKE